MPLTSKFSIFLIVAIFILSCKKEKKATTPQDQPVSYPDYTVLKPGNYWIYQDFQINEDGTEMSFDIYDSSYVEKDTVIDNLTYHKLISSGNDYFLRDSLSYLLEFLFNGQRKILFSSQDFTDTLELAYNINGTYPFDTTSKSILKMTDKDVEYNTPAGNFYTCNAQYTLLFYHVYQNHHNNVLRKLNTRYAKNIGKISETISARLDSPVVYIEKRLLRYHLQ